MTEQTLVVNDIQWFTFYLKEKDPTSGSITYYDITSAGTITFSMRKYGASTNAVSAVMSILTGTLGYCRVKATVPAEGRYSSQIQVNEGSQLITWTGPTYMVIPELV